MSYMCSGVLHAVTQYLYTDIHKYTQLYIMQGSTNHSCGGSTGCTELLWLYSIDTVGSLLSLVKKATNTSDVTSVRFDKRSGVAGLCLLGSCGLQNSIKIELNPLLTSIITICTSYCSAAPIEVCLSKLISNNNNYKKELFPN